MFDFWVSYVWLDIVENDIRIWDKWSWEWGTAQEVVVRMVEELCAVHGLELKDNDAQDRELQGWGMRIQN